MNTDTAKSISKHLEFLGYEISNITENKETESDFLIATHAIKPNLIIFAREKITYFISRYTGVDITLGKNLSFWDTINGINSNTNVTTWSLEDDEKKSEIILKISGNFFGYEKESFGLFLDLFFNDISYGHDKLKDFVK